MAREPGGLTRSLKGLQRSPQEQVLRGMSDEDLERLVRVARGVETERGFGSADIDDVVFIHDFFK